MKTLLRLSAVLSIALLAAAPASAQSDDAIGSFFPPGLDAKLGNRATNHQWCSTALTSYPNGTPHFIAAGYANGVDGAVRLLERVVTGSLSVAYDVSGAVLSGTECDAESVDFDGDGTNELLISFISPRGNAVAWVFRLVGSQLENVTPLATVGGMSFSALLNPTVVDLAHDGKRQILSVAEYPPPPDNPPSPETLYHLGPTGLAAGAEVFLYHRFTRERGEPNIEEVGFAIDPQSVSGKVLHISNGIAGGDARVSAAQVWLNGTLIVGSSVFNQQVEFLDVPLSSLAAENVLRVRLEGAPGSTLTVSLQASATP